MRDPLRPAGHLLLLAAAAAIPFVFPQPAVAVAAVDAVVLFLGALSVVPIVGWLRTVTFAGPAAAGVGGWVAAALLQRGQSLPIAVVAGAAAGAVLSVVALAPVRKWSRTGLPWSSLVALLVVWGLLLTATSAPGMVRAVFIGVDMSSPLALYVTGLLLAALSVMATLQLAGSREGRLLATSGAAPDYARHAGGDGDRLSVLAVAHSGAIAGFAGVLLALQLQGVPTAVSLSPATALTWLGVALIGGAGWTSGVLAGTVALTVLVALTPLPAAVIGPALLVIAVLTQRSLVGVVALPRRRPRAVA